MLYILKRLHWEFCGEWTVCRNGSWGSRNRAQLGSLCSSSECPIIIVLLTSGSAFQNWSFDVTCGPKKLNRKFQAYILFKLNFTQFWATWWTHTVLLFSIPEMISPHLLIPHFMYYFLISCYMAMLSCQISHHSITVLVFI